MYPAITRVLTGNRGVDFRDPDHAGCPLYRFVDRDETVLGPGDVLWNPPFVGNRECEARTAAPEEKRLIQDNLFQATVCRPWEGPLRGVDHATLGD